MTLNRRLFMFAGNAIFTITSTKTGASYTYKIAFPREDREEGPLFASVLTGPDNLRNYTYMGIVTGYNTRHVHLKPTRASKVAADAPSARALAWFLKNTDDPRVEFRHVGRCARCGRALTVPSSIDSGFGPECAGKVGL